MSTPSSSSASQTESPGALGSLAQRTLMLALVVLPVAIVCWAASTDRPLGWLTLGLQVATVAALVLCEFVLSFERRWGSTVKGGLSDFIYAGAAAGVEKLTFIICLAAAAVLGRLLSVELGIGLWPSDWWLPFQVVLGLVIADAGAYFRHRLFHVVPALWRFHRIHHSMTGLYWIRSAYTHPLEQLAIMMAIMFPISLMGAGNTVLVIVAFAFGLSGLIQHANVDARSGWLNHVFATPEVHRFHHGANEISNAANFSAFFVFMDKLFGSFHDPDRYTAPRVVGLAGVKRFPRSFFRHLSMPFREDGDAVEIDADWRPEEIVFEARQPAPPSPPAAPAPSTPLPRRSIEES